eukprot:2710524-Ditylum_brightwellii.AAC.1
MTQLILLDITWADEDGCTKLLFAAYYGRRNRVEELVFVGADVDKPDNNGYTPLLSGLSTSAPSWLPRMDIVMLWHCSSQTEQMSTNATKGWCDSCSYGYGYNHFATFMLFCRADGEAKVHEQRWAVAAAAASDA